MIVKAEIQALTGIRFFAALFVLLHHVSVDYLSNLFPSLYRFTEILFYSGGMGVDLFFILSGFILAYNYMDIFSQFSVSSYLEFLYKRIARIYPVYIVSLAILVVLAIIQYSDTDIYPNRLRLSDLPENLLLLQSWKIPASFNWNTVSWSVSAEWLAYLLFPLFAGYALKLHSPKLIIGLITLLYILLILSIMTLIVVYPDGKIEFPSFRDIGLLRILFEFPMGMLAYVLLVRQKLVSVKVASRWFSVIILLSFFTPLAMLWAVPCFLWIIYMTAKGQFPFTDFLSSKWIVYGGRISYCLYLVHGVWLVIFGMYFSVHMFVDESLWLRVGYIVAYIFLTIVLTLFLYHVIEEPCRRWLLKKWPFINQVAR